MIFYVWLLMEYPPRGSVRREPPGRAEFEADRNRICTALGRATIDRSGIVAKIEHFGPRPVDVFVTHAWKDATLDFRKGSAVYVSTCETNRRSRVSIRDAYTGDELAAFSTDTMTVT